MTRDAIVGARYIVPTLQVSNFEFRIPPPAGAGFEFLYSGRHLIQSGHAAMHVVADVAVEHPRPGIIRAHTIPLLRQRFHPGMWRRE
jgi:hypothetical protein